MPLPSIRPNHAESQGARRILAMVSMAIRTTEPSGALGEPGKAPLPPARGGGTRSHSESVDRSIAGRARSMVASVESSLIGPSDSTSLNGSTTGSPTVTTTTAGRPDLRASQQFTSPARGPSQGGASPEAKTPSFGEIVGRMSQRLGAAQSSPSTAADRQQPTAEPANADVHHDATKASALPGRRKPPAADGGFTPLKGHTGHPAK
jgi:hypothetical protein